VPYRAAAPALQDLACDHVDLLFATPQSVLEQVAAGQIKAYGITARQQSPLFPRVASLGTEIGPKLEILYWHALFVPAARQRR
jgi:tripartite-type tricarboxylate transporter receptor subunit TctC